MNIVIIYGEWFYVVGMFYFDKGFDEVQYYDEVYVQGKLREFQLWCLEGMIEEIFFFLCVDFF